MPSKYGARQPKPITKQTPALKSLGVRVANLKSKQAHCTNCGTASNDYENKFSKCRCGGTFQRYQGER